MRRTSVAALFFLFTLAGVYGQCLTSPISMRVGIKPGLTICTDDQADGGDVFQGTGLHIGIGMGSDFFRLIALDMTPQFRTTSFGRDEASFRRIYSYKNLMFPLFLSLKGGMIPLISPYIGFGIGFGLQFDGTERREFPNGTATEDKLAGSNAQGFILLGGGLEIKLSKLRITPSFTANISGSGDETHPPKTEEKDYDISAGLYYSP